MITLDDFQPLSAAEEKLLSESHLPNRTTVGDGNLPVQASPDTTVRADLIRLLLLGSSEGQALHDKGVRLRGARITGTLDLQGCDCPRDISLSQCILTDPLNLVNATVRGLHISGCQMQGIAADNACFGGSVYIRSDTYIAGEISLSGARISGDLQICEARIETTTQDAIFAPSLRVEGSVFLGNYPYSDTVTTLSVTGLLFFSSARVEHDFFFTNTEISLPDRSLTPTVFGASEEHGSDMALSLARARIGGILYMKDNQIIRGIVNLAGAEAGRLTDEPAAPGANFPIRLDGFRYSDFSRHADTNITARLDWLRRRPADMPFTAQPYEQLSDVLTSIGHRNDAQTVLMEKERMLRMEARRLMEGAPLTQAVSWLSDCILRLTIGYGYRPGRSVVVAVVLILGLGFFYQATWRAGDFAPNSGPVLVSDGWIKATRDYPDNPAAYWSSRGQPGEDWETFNAFAYSADLVIPIVSLGQEDAWAPSTNRSPLGQTGWWLRWFAKAIGWIITALGAAAITGLIRKE